jgi:hypothetical protein
MAKKKQLFLEESFIPTFGEEFSQIVEPEFDTQIWTSESVNDLLNKIETQGADISKIKNPFFEKDPNLRRGRIAFQMTKDELIEFKKCRKDILYFANKYIHLMTDKGIRKITLYDYQEKMLVNYQNNSLNIVLGSRQIGT